MKKGFFRFTAAMFLAIVATVTIAACTTAVMPNGAPPTPAAQAAADKANWTKACIAYKGAQDGLIAALPHMNLGQIKAALVITHQITPLCQTLPPDPNAAVAKITASITTLAVMTAVQKATHQ